MSISILAQNIFYFINGYDFPWLYGFRYNFFEFTILFISTFKLYFLYNLINYKKKIDTFDLKWLKIPFYFTILSFIVILSIRLYINDTQPLSRTLNQYNSTFLVLIFYFVLFMGQNFFLNLKKYWYANFIYISSMPLIFFYYINYLARDYHKHKYFWFLFEN